MAGQSTTHSPGPWYVTVADQRARYLTVRDKTGRTVARVWRSTATLRATQPCTANADARLIHAGPTMLTALRLAADVLRNVPTHPVNATIRDAIAEATGAG